MIWAGVPVRLQDQATQSFVEIEGTDQLDTQCQRTVQQACFALLQDCTLIVVKVVPRGFAETCKTRQQLLECRCSKIACSLRTLQCLFGTCEPSSCSAGGCRALGGERFALWGAPGAL